MLCSWNFPFEKDSPICTGPFQECSLFSSRCTITSSCSHQKNATKQNSWLLPRNSTQWVWKKRIWNHIISKKWCFFLFQHSFRNDCILWKTASRHAGTCYIRICTFTFNTFTCKPKSFWFYPKWSNSGMKQETMHCWVLSSQIHGLSNWAGRQERSKSILMCHSWRNDLRHGTPHLGSHSNIEDSQMRGWPA